MTPIERHLLHDLTVVLLREHGELTPDREAYLNDLRDAIWKELSSSEADELDERWRQVVEPFKAQPLRVVGSDRR